MDERPQSTEEEIAAIERRTASLRAHAQHNRERILEAASEALLDDEDLSLNEIAERAGVASGTLYRHFPTREALVLEVYRHEVKLVADAATDLLERMAPAEALREWMTWLAEYAMTKGGIADALHGAVSGERLAAESYRPIVGALSTLLAASEKEGTIRSGVDADDLLLVLGFLWRLEPDGDWEGRASRLLDVLMDGLRAGAPVGEREAAAQAPAGEPSETQPERLFDTASG
ncbi:MAG TPA: helix-turn-helix domain-containing protein [Solirubrobacteraceae bacterium]|nr:helix-turn-helix domain-containing protein [Solirubrobacteraceae bacterium]